MMSAKYMFGLFSALLLPTAFTAPTGNTGVTPSGFKYCPPRPATLETQQKIFAEFVEIMFTERNITKAYGIYLLTDPDFVDHDSVHGSSKADVLAAVTPWFHDASFSVWKTFLQDNIGITVEMGVMANGTAAAFADFWRFDGTCIVEHWDVVQYLPTDSPNPSPLFPLPPPVKAATDTKNSQ